jgi:hypothetical protein
MAGANYQYFGASSQSSGPTAPHFPGVERQTANIITASIIVRVPLDLEHSEPRAAAARMLLDVIEHGISARRHALPGLWLGNVDLDEGSGIITLTQAQ